MRNLLRAGAGVIVAATLLPVSAEAGDRSRATRTDLRVTSDPGVQIAVREVRPARPSPRPPVLLLHGARVPGVASFDLPVPGGSLAGDLAAAGHRVYIMDARGYGASARPRSMDQDPLANPPAVRSDQVVRDVASVVDLISRRTEHQRVALLGWATGGHWLGQYAAAHPHRVSHLVLYNTLYGAHDGHPTLGRGSDYEDPARPGQFHAAAFGAYRFNTADSLLPSWDAGIPVGDKAVWRDPAVVAAYQRAALASDPTSGTRTPPSFRAPTGALEDSFLLATGRQLWDASLITAPTLILRSEYDFWSRPEDPRAMRDHLVHAANVRSVELSGATHYAHLDRHDHGRGQLLAETTAFLA